LVVGGAALAAPFALGGTAESAEKNLHHRGTEAQRKTKIILTSVKLSQDMPMKNPSHPADSIRNAVVRGVVEVDRNSGFLPSVGMTKWEESR